jgi:hypothetical protein
MTEIQSKPSREDSQQIPECKMPSTRWFWAWFAIGFSLVFLVMALSVKMDYMHPSGSAVVECRLWKYYIVEFRRQLSVSSLGPAQSNISTLLQTIFFHVFFSILGGGVFAGMRLLVGKLKK